jgi:hypothetical protein
MKIFNEIEVQKIPRNNFDLSHERKLTCNMGDLIPVLCEEAVPGDTFKISEEHLIRFAPMSFPVMHRFDCFIHYFVVPYRILWDDYERFMTGGERGQYLMEKCPVLPRFRIDSKEVYDKYFSNGTLSDYLTGIPHFPMLPPSFRNFDINLLPYMAYQKIYDDYYRVQDLIMSEIDPDDIQEAQNEFMLTHEHFTRERKIKSGIYPVTKPGGARSPLQLFKLRRRSWQRDYFTTALPRPQKGPEVSFGSGIVYLDQENRIEGKLIKVNQTPVTPGTQPLLREYINQEGVNIVDANGTKYSYDPNGSLKSGLTTISELRRAKALQIWLERNARGGSRLVEYLKNQFGVTSSDKRLQRPEYIGGSHTNIIISEVLQTSETNETPLGEMGGHGLCQDGNYCGEAFIEEHSFIIGLMSIMPKPGYMQGMRRIFQKFDPFDYFIPDFEHIGEQEITNKELFFKPDHINESNLDKVFGYQSRFSEYKYIPDMIFGDFRTTMTDWHEARIFKNMPTLSQEFIECKIENRIFAVTDPEVHHIWVQLYQAITARRPLTVFSNPSTTI